MKEINVNLTSYPYKVLIGNGIFTELQEIIKANKLHKNIFCLIDKSVYSIYKKDLEKVFTPPPRKFNFLTIDAKEGNKSLSTLKKIYTSLVVSNYGRDSLLIAIGGGIIGDVGGFAAATYTRGIRYIQIPTTLLSAVDSSVGGKTGINFGSTKNIIGSFYQPNLVLIDINFLTTIPKREIISGIGEILKYAFLIKGDYFDYFEKNLDKLIALDKKVLTKIIAESVEYKAAVVVRDEKEESGIRKILNLGHTFAHAIEVEHGHKLKHGETVIIGLACALYLSNKLNLLNNDELEEGIILIKKLSSNIRIKKMDFNKILDLMKRDKKSKDEDYKFVLLNGFGKVLIDVEAENNDVLWALKQGVKLFS